MKSPHDQTPDDFPPFDPPPPVAGQTHLSTEDSAALHESIAQAFGVPPPGQTQQGVQHKEISTADVFSHFGSSVPSQTDLLLMDIRNLVRDIKTAVDSLPTNLAQAMEGSSGNR